MHNRSAMLADLVAGTGGFNNQYVVIHPETKSLWNGLSLMDVPEYVFEGVRVWARAVPQGTKVLLVQPRSQDADVVYTIANSLGDPVEVIPVGRVLDNLPSGLKSIITGSTSAYALLEALTIYSHVYDEPFAVASTALSLGGLSQAQTSQMIDAAYCVTSSLKSGAVEPSYRKVRSGTASYFVDRRPKTIRFERWGSSTENGLGNQMNTLASALGQTASNLGNTNKGNSQPTWRGTAENPSDFMLKRSMASGPGPDDYFPSAAEILNYHTWMKFDYQYDKDTPRTGDWNAQCMDQAYYGSTWSAITKALPMRNAGQKVNFFPMRWYIATERLLAPETIVMSDNTHLSARYLRGVSSGMLTLLSGGRCYVGQEPQNVARTDTSWQTWHAQMTGYQLAYRFATLKERAPCFQILPDTETNLNQARTIQVRFLLPPLAPVVVSVTSSIAAGVVLNTNQIVFGPSNYSSSVSVTIASSGLLPTATPVDIIFTTQSDDDAYDSLEDLWTYDSAPNTDPSCGLNVDNATMQCYLARYLNLSNTFGDDLNAARCHWIIEGNRTGLELQCESRAPTSSPAPVTGSPVSTQPSVTPSSAPITEVPSAIPTTLSPSPSPSTSPSQAPSQNPIDSTSTINMPLSSSIRSTSYTASSTLSSASSTSFSTLSTTSTASTASSSMPSSSSSSATELTSVPVSVTSRTILATTSSAITFVDSSEGDADGSSDTKIAIIVVALILLLLLIATAVVLLIRKQRETSTRSSSSVPNPMYEPAGAPAFHKSARPVSVSLDDSHVTNEMC